MRRKDEARTNDPRAMREVRQQHAVRERCALTVRAYRCRDVMLCASPFTQNSRHRQFMFVACRSAAVSSVTRGEIQVPPAQREQHSWAPLRALCAAHLWRRGVTYGMTLRDMIAQVLQNGSASRFQQRRCASWQ
jgi:hypothetical protein